MIGRIPSLLTMMLHAVAVSNQQLRARRAARDGELLYRGTRPARWWWRCYRFRGWRAILVQRRQRLRCRGAEGLCCSSLQVTGVIKPMRQSVETCQCHARLPCMALSNATSSPDQELIAANPIGATLWPHAWRARAQPDVSSMQQRLLQKSIPCTSGQTTLLRA